MPPKKSAPKPPLKKDAKAAKAEAKKKEAADKVAKTAAKTNTKTKVSAAKGSKAATPVKAATPAKPAKSSASKAKATGPVAPPAAAPAKKDTKRGAKDTGKVVDSGPTKKSKTDTAVAKAAVPATKDDKKDDAVIVKVITKGGAAVDALVPNKENYRVLQDGGKTYSATLNQSNLDGNNNKFYIIQVLQNEKTNSIFVWNRWGRVGVPGQNALKGPFGKDAAIREYNSKHHEKAVKGDYVQLEIKYDDDDQKKDDPKQKKVLKTGTSKMDKAVQDLINLIFDTNVMNNTMKEIGYDAKKMPLGKLGDSTIKEAYKVLSNLSAAIKKKDHAQIKSLSGQFYSLIPHDFGFQKMINFILDTDEKVKQKLDMLAAISDMKITTKLLENQNTTDDVVDQNYKKLGCKIASIDKTAKEYKTISDYLHNTKQGWKIDIDAIYKIQRPDDEKKFNKKIGNNMLLWHGSRIANFVGILSQGLRIAPPEAPVSGYLFGKGIYLADMIDKSAHYCRSYGSDKALCLLVEGAIGDPNVLLNSSYEAKELMEKAKKNSTKCHGSKAPPPESYVKQDSYIVPQGKAKPTGSGSWMGHNEYIVYDVSQAKIRYVVKMKMN